MEESLIRVSLQSLYNVVLELVKQQDSYYRRAFSDQRAVYGPDGYFLQYKSVDEVMYYCSGSYDSYSCILLEPKVIMTERNTIRVKRDLEDYKVFVS